jgi:uncharacterized protein involved in exopolysaccharide biosynthesis
VKFWRWTVLSDREVAALLQSGRDLVAQLTALHIMAKSLREQVDAFRRLMAATIQQLRDELATANETTNEVAADLDAVIKKLADAGGNQAEIDAALVDAQALSAKLRGVADTYTPDATA